jgi:hypothetical protein
VEGACINAWQNSSLQSFVLQEYNWETYILASLSVIPQVQHNVQNGTACFSCTIRLGHGIRKFPHCSTGNEHYPEDDAKTGN